ncbi:hypothetical protein [Methylobacterium sp. JK268]
MSASTDRDSIERLPVLTPPTRDRVCSNCEAFAPIDTVLVSDQAGHLIGRRPTGECRRRAPTLHPDAPYSGFGLNAGSWPSVDAIDWCREFQRRLQNYAWNRERGAAE